MRSGRMPIALLNARNLPKWSLTHTGTADPVSPGRKVIYRGMWFAHTLITPRRSSRSEEQAMNASSDPDEKRAKRVVEAITNRLANGVPNDPMKPAFRGSSSLPVDYMTARIRLANNFATIC